MNDRLVYFDNINATFPDLDVIRIIDEVLYSKAGNPASHIHSAGINAGRILDKARSKVAALIAGRPESIIFTSGATESNNLAISGFMKANPDHRLAVAEIEHFSIINQARKMQGQGARIDHIKVDASGRIDLDRLRGIVRTGPTLVSVAPANPEIGTIQDLGVISDICGQHGAVLHCDATAAAAFMEIDVAGSGIGLLTLSGHNMYGPMGIGALYVAENVRIAPLFEGGNQQLGMRPGTENLSGAAGMGEACALVMKNQQEWNERLFAIGQKLWKGLADSVPFIHFTGHPEQRLPGHVSFWVEHIEGESLLLLLNMNGVMAASGSACSSNLKGKDEEDLVASHVLTAVGVPTNICAGSITFSLGKYNTGEEVDYVISIMPGIVEKLLAMSPSYSDYMRKRSN
jgi:cysteine desulfurase